uniref:A to I editase domain-containing protein n=1 Tax=Acanthochromis polyacanthus TaxID=80966 RepID=A0A3Q1GLJ8_9TELE
MVNRRDTEQTSTHTGGNALLTCAEYQQPGKASCVSVNWTMGDTQLEVVNTATGRRRDSGTASRLCKHALFTRWNRLYRNSLSQDYIETNIHIHTYGELRIIMNLSMFLD